MHSALGHLFILSWFIDLTNYQVCQRSIIIQNMSSTVQCHYCGQQRDKNYLLGFIAKCCIKRCNKYFCIHCIRSHFNPEFEENNYRKDTWICYFCQESCSCLKCKNQQLNEMERKNKRRSKNSLPKQNEESPQLHSASNLSLSNNANSISANSHNLAAQKVQMTVEVTQKPNGQDEENIEKNIICYANIHQQMLIPVDDMILLPPYLKKIAERKNMYYQFMMKQSKSKQQKNSKKIKQIISNELSRRKGDTDGIDMQLE